MFKDYMDYGMLKLVTGSCICTLLCKYHTDIHFTDAYPNKIYIYNSPTMDSSSVSWLNKKTLYIK